MMRWNFRGRRAVLFGVIAAGMFMSYFDAVYFDQTIVDSKVESKSKQIEIETQDEGKGKSNLSKASLSKSSSLGNEETPNHSVSVVETTKYKHNFTYDRQSWDNHSPRIAVLAGPHKTASTTLQTFFAKIAGSTVILSNQTAIPGRKKHRGGLLPPHPNVTDWVWPVGVKEEFKEESSLGGGFKQMSNAKFFAPLASLISGRRIPLFFKFQKKNRAEKEKALAKAADYFRSLFQRTWEEGKKILIGAEAFDSLVMGLVSKTVVSDRGEETHVSPDSSAMIDALLDLLPLQDADGNLRLEEIEVQINYRTPRIDHVVSIWHQLGRRKNLRRFVREMGGGKTPNLYQLNSLALALQFVRRGIKTTIVDMQGVSQKESKELSTRKIVNKKASEEKTDKETIVSGLQGVVACDILKMGTESGLCDENSRLHLPNYDEPVKNQNQKSDTKDRGMTDEEMQMINRAFEEYDCGVWQHLQKYQAQGFLRILYPSEGLFATCNPGGSRDISYRETLETTKAIAS